MPRRLQQPFHCAPLAELTRQLSFAPPAKRLEQLRRAERLHDEIDADSAYPIEYLVYRVTGYRPGARDESMLLVGEAVRPDLRLLIDQLSRSFALPADDEPGATVREVAARLHVSEKTVHRWRHLGLRWRWVAPTAGGQAHVLIPDAALARFIEQNPQRVERASRFNVLSDHERAAVLARARELVAEHDAPPTPHRVAARIAREIGRGAETVRLLLKKHDRDHPDQAIFAAHERPLTPRQQRLIARAHRRGVSVARIAGRLNRSRYTVHRVLRLRRAAAARQVDLQHVHHASFDRDDAEAVIRHGPLEAVPMPRAAAAGRAAAESGTTSRALPDDLPEPLRGLYRQPTVSASRQRAMFVRYNFLKHRARQVRAALARRDPRAAELDRFEALLAESRTVRAALVRANLPVVLSVVRRQLIGQQSALPAQLFELLEAGQDVLFEAIESYNAGWSHSFTSYLTNRLLTRFAQSVSTTDTPAGSTRQARRRRTAEQVRQQLVAHARAHHVELERADEP